MEALVIVGLFVVFFVVIPLLIGTLRQTAWFWLPAAVLFVLGALTIASLRPVGSGREEGAETILYLFGLAMYAYAALALLIGAVGFFRHQKREHAARKAIEPTPLPVATVVR